MLLFLAVGVNAANTHTCSAGEDLNTRAFLLCCNSRYCVCTRGVQGVLRKSEEYARDMDRASLAGLDTSDLVVMDSIAMNSSSQMKISLSCEAGFAHAVGHLGLCVPSAALLAACLHLFTRRLCFPPKSPA